MASDRSYTATAFEVSLAPVMAGSPYTIVDTERLAERLHCAGSRETTCYPKECRPCSGHPRLRLGPTNLAMPIVDYPTMIRQEYHDLLTAILSSMAKKEEEEPGLATPEQLRIVKGLILSDLLALPNHARIHGEPRIHARVYEWFILELTKSTPMSLHKHLPHKALSRGDLLDSPSCFGEQSPLHLPGGISRSRSDELDQDDRKSVSVLLYASLDTGGALGRFFPSTQEPTPPSKKQIKSFYDKFGGTARHALREAGDPAFFEAQINNAATLWSADDIRHVFGSGITYLSFPDDLGHMLVH
ncbi:hypothetical protein DFH09DRAFT_1083191 [Mycena vulgaris]|nr:hypothetical protein DFH09DRAFT_1083191 [Mycena vulgaris]